MLFRACQGENTSWYTIVYFQLFQCFDSFFFSQKTMWQMDTSSVMQPESLDAFVLASSDIPVQQTQPKVIRQQLVRKWLVWSGDQWIWSTGISTLLCCICFCNFHSVSLSHLCSLQRLQCRPCPCLPFSIQSFVFVHIPFARETVNSSRTTCFVV